VDWDDVATPARILSIVNLHNLKPNSRIRFPGQDEFLGEPGLYVVVQSYDAIDNVHVSPKKRRWKKGPRAQVGCRVILEEKDPPIFKSYRLSLLDDSLHLPKIYIVHVDSIMGPTVVMSDASREYGNHDPSVVAQPSCPYIFMSRGRDQWADNWMSFIDWQYENKTVHEGIAESSEEED
jgi:hypothetical protein